MIIIFFYMILFLVLISLRFNQTFRPVIIYKNQFQNSSSKAFRPYQGRKALDFPSCFETTPSESKIRAKPFSIQDDMHLAMQVYIFCIPA